MSRKYREIAEALDGLLREGERLVVTLEDERVIVRELEQEEDHVPSLLAETDEKLYGYLLLVNGRIDNSTGCLWPAFLLAAAVAAAGAIYTRRPNLSVWWVYSLIVILLGVIWAMGVNWREQVAYASHRGELFSRLAERNLTREELLAQIAGDKFLAKISSYLTADHAADTV